MQRTSASALSEMGAPGRGWVEEWDDVSQERLAVVLSIDCRGQQWNPGLREEGPVLIRVWRWRRGAGCHREVRVSASLLSTSDSRAKNFLMARVQVHIFNVTYFMDNFSCWNQRLRDSQQTFSEEDFRSPVIMVVPPIRTGGQRSLCNSPSFSRSIRFSFFSSFFWLLLFLFIGFKERGCSREKREMPMCCTTYVHSLLDPCMCPDWGWNL